MSDAATLDRPAADAASRPSDAPSADAPPAMADRSSGAASLAFGIHAGVPMEVYNADRSALRSSDLRNLLVSPRHYQDAIEREPAAATEAMTFGHAFDDFLLSPEDFKAQWAPVAPIPRAEGYKEARAKQAAAIFPRRPIPLAWLAEFEQMRANVLRHREAARLLGSGQSQVSLVWLDAETGIKCKARPDFLSDADGLSVVHLKTTAERDQRGFYRQIKSLCYAEALAFYELGVQQTLGADDFRSYWLAADKNAPHCSNLWYPSARMLQAARRRVRAALVTLAHCRATGVFPAPQDDGIAREMDLLY